MWLPGERRIVYGVLAGFILITAGSLSGVAYLIWGKHSEHLLWTPQPCARSARTG